MARLSRLTLILMLASTLVCISTCHGAVYAGEHEWIDPPPEGMAKYWGLPVIEEKYVFEVVASKSEIAIYDLTDSPFIRLSADRAKWFTGSYYFCPAGMQPYLVRAPFGQGGTGRFSVTHAGNILIVSHGSLGSSWVANKSALVVNLDFEPGSLYTFVSMAK